MNRILVLCALAVLAAPMAVAQTFPPGITNETLVTGFSQPVGLCFLAAGTGDERFFVIEQDTHRLFVANAAGGRQQVGLISGVSSSGNERGLLGVVTDPGFPARPYVYFHLTSTSQDVRIVRYTVTGDIANPNSLSLGITDRYTVLSGMPNQRFNHNGGTVRFGPDGMLYASLGDDAANPCNAQTINDGRGIIFRMDVSNLPAGPGGPPAISSLRPATGNPFTGTAYAPITYAYGLRNPFRFNIDPVTGNLYIADVGQNAWEEFNELSSAGANFGWPRFEGNASFSGSCPTSGPLTAPIVAVSQSEGWLSIVPFGGRYRNVPGGSRNLGPAYEGQVLYSDFFSGQVRRLELSGSTWSNPTPVSGQTNPTNWGTNVQSPADSIIGPDGAIYWVSLSRGTVSRVAGDPNAVVMSVVAGEGPANAGARLGTAMRVRLATIGGTPAVGRTVTWTSTGSITLDGSTSVTDANGEATMSGTMGATFSGIPNVTATAGSSSIQVRPTWRGVSTNVVSNFVVLSIRHSAANAPVILAIDTPVAGPYISTPFGDIWTSILNPGSTAFVIDGFGLVGPLDPSAVTSAGGVWNRVFTISPSTGGLQVQIQAYGADPAFAPGTAENVFISNAPVITLP